MLCQEDILLVGKHSLAVFLEVISSCFAVVLVTVFHYNNNNNGNNN